MTIVDETPEEAARVRALSDVDIILPAREVVLTNGHKVIVRPWGLRTGALVIGRLEALTPKLIERDDEGHVRAVGLDPRALITRAYDEILDLIELTVGIARADLEREPIDGGWTLEDLLGVTEAMLEVCVLRADGRGALPLLLALVGRMQEVVIRAIGPTLASRAASEIAQQRSSDSEPEGTSAAASPNGSGSRPARARKGRS